MQAIGGDCVINHGMEGVLCHQLLHARRTSGISLLGCSQRDIRPERSIETNANGMLLVHVAKY